MQCWRELRVLSTVLLLSGAAFGQQELDPNKNVRESKQRPVVRVRNCNHLSQAQLTELLTLELDTLRDGRDISDVRIGVHCLSSSLVLSARVGTRPPAERRLEGSPTTVFERPLILAASEMVAELWDGDAEGVREFKPTLSRSPPAERPEKTFKERSLASVFVGLEHFGRPSRTLSSFGVGWTWTALSFVHLGAEVRGGGGTITTTEAFVTQETLTFAPRLHGVLPLGPARLRVGATVPVGVVRLTPDSRVKGASESDLTAPWSALLGDFESFYSVDERFVVILGASGGTTFLPVRGTAAKTPLVELAGPIFGARLGLGISF